MNASEVAVRPVADDQWELVAWLFQAYRNDLATAVNGFPCADGRYRHSGLDDFPGPGRAGYLAWAAHPGTGEQAPVGFALVWRLDTDRAEMADFWIAPAARRGGLGRRVALDVIGSHRGPWEIAFQQENRDAGPFWRRVATEAFGAVGEAWAEDVRAVPGKPHVPPDHWITTL